MTLLLLTAALASMAYADPAVGPVIIGYPSLFGASDRSANVAQTGTLTNSGPVQGDLIQYTININEVRIGHLWKSELSEDESNSVAVRKAVIKYILHDSSFRNKLARIVDDISKGIVVPDYQAGTDPRGTITNSGAVQGSYNQFSVYINGLDMTKNEIDVRFSTDDNYETSPVSRNLRGSVQTGTITNSGAIERDLTQYIINMNDLTIDEIGRS